jgi:hypothetical protein
MPGGEAVMLYRSLERTQQRLGRDARAWARLVGPFLESPHELLADAMAPLRIPAHPALLLRFGIRGAFSANRLARLLFRDAPARALFAGCAGHSIQPLTAPFTAALGLMFAILGHVEDWPVAEGGSRMLARSLASYLEKLGGRIETGRRIERLEQLPRSRVVLFSTPRRSSYRALPETRCRKATVAGSAGIGMAPASSSSTGPSTVRFPGATRLVWKPRPCTSAEPSRRSARRSATCTAAVTASAPISSSASRASSTAPGRPRDAIPATPTATFRTARPST